MAYLTQPPNIPSEIIQAEAWAVLIQKRDTEVKARVRAGWVYAPALAMSDSIVDCM